MLIIINNKNIAFIGAGSMAEGMISGIVQSDQIPATQIYVTNRSNKNRLEELHQTYGIQGKGNEELDFDQIDTFILAMKPKDAEAALSALKNKVKPHQLVLSVLAGITTSYLEDLLHDQQPVIRVMPNTSSTIGASATAMSSGRHVSKEQELMAKEILGCMGEVYAIEENKMDVFTGIAGSGPAYFYYLMEHIEKAGEAAGLDKKMSCAIGAQTLLGAAKMLLETGETPTVLREKVTSPNGTTAAGLHALEQFGGGEAIEQAIKEAAKRSEEISKEMNQLNLVR
ncbi:pyrroline-5-carboxylate reductase [Bacillus gobiensis]|uniref:pyrroline-5-carboxylate reductase n=1 Tax=Bacillus gobiensis TaxID=1441095 RepID=UPI003D23C3C8